MKDVFATLLGKTLVSVEVIKAVDGAGDEIVFVDDTGQTYVMYHDQDCCEDVHVESIVGDLNDLLGTPLLMAEEVVSNEWPVHAIKGEWDHESDTWTFYKLATVKGYVDIRWHGSSNGHYSESVTFKLKK